MHLGAPACRTTILQSCSTKILACDAGSLAAFADAAPGAGRGAAAAPAAAWLAATALGGVVEVQGLGPSEYAALVAVDEAAGCHPLLRPLTGGSHAAFRGQGARGGAACSSSPCASALRSYHTQVWSYHHGLLPAS